MLYVFFLNNFLTGGSQTVLYNIASITKKRILLVPVFQEYNKNLIQKLPQNVEIFDTGITHKNIIGSFFRLPLIIKRLKQNIKSKGRNYICINFTDRFLSLFFTYVIGKKNSITWLHCCPKTLLLSRLKPFYFIMMNKFKEIVFICNSQKELFLSHNKTKKINKPMNYVCTNFININAINEIKNEEIEHAKSYFFMAARLDESSKDFYTLLKAYSLLPKITIDRYDLIIAGDGIDRKKIESYINSLDLSEHVFLIGNVNNPYKWMYNSTIYIHSSKHEGFPMVLIEALACGCNVVSSDCETGPAEILDYGRCGELYKVGDVDGLREAILKALSKDEVECKKKSINRASEINTKGVNEIYDFFNIHEKELIK